MLHLMRTIVLVQRVFQLIRLLKKRDNSPLQNLFLDSLSLDLLIYPAPNT